MVAVGAGYVLHAEFGQVWKNPALNLLNSPSPWNSCTKNAWDFFHGLTLATSLKKIVLKIKSGKMTKIVSSPNCGNSPKMEFLKEFNIAFAEGKLEFIIEAVTDDIVWDIIGDKKIEGKERFTKELEKMKSEKAIELKIDQILSHGKEGASNGIMKMQNGKQHAFSDFYIFKNTKSNILKSITSYVIEI